MSKSDITWLAGLLEGEGYFGWNGVGTALRYGLPTVKLGMTDRDVVERVAKLMEAHSVRTTPARGRRKEVFITQVVGTKAVHVMRMVLPYMAARRSERIRELLLQWAARPGRAGAGRKSWETRRTEAALGHHSLRRALKNKSCQSRRYNSQL